MGLPSLSLAAGDLPWRFLSGHLFHEARLRRVARRAPRQLLRLSFVGDATPDQGMVAGLGTLHFFPLALLADNLHATAHLAGFPCRVDDPADDSLFFSHPPIPSIAALGEKENCTRAVS